MIKLTSVRFDCRQISGWLFIKLINSCLLVKKFSTWCYGMYIFGVKCWLVGGKKEKSLCCLFVWKCITWPNIWEHLCLYLHVPFHWFAEAPLFWEGFYIDFGVCLWRFVFIQPYWALMSDWEHSVFQLIPKVFSGNEEMITLQHTTVFATTVCLQSCGKSLGKNHVWEQWSDVQIPLARLGIIFLLP